MTNLLIKLIYYIDLKNNKLIKLYLSSFYILYIIYFVLEVINNKLVSLFNTYPEQQKFYFEKVQNIITLTSIIDILLIILNLLYLVINLNKYKQKKNKGLVQYLFISFISLLSIQIVSSILYIVFSTHFLLQPTFLLAEITVIVFVFSLINFGYKFLLSKYKHENL